MKKQIYSDDAMQLDGACVVYRPNEDVANALRIQVSPSRQRGEPLLLTATCPHGTTTLRYLPMCREEPWHAHLDRDEHARTCRWLNLSTDALERIAALLHGKQYRCFCNALYWMAAGPTEQAFAVHPCRTEERPLSREAMRYMIPLEVITASEAAINDGTENLVVRGVRTTSCHPITPGYIDGLRDPYPYDEGTKNTWAVQTSQTYDAFDRACSSAMMLPGVAPDGRVLEKPPEPPQDAPESPETPNEPQDTSEDT